MQYPLLSDFPDRKTIRAYGILNERTMTAIRTFFLIDPQGMIRFAPQGLVVIGVNAREQKEAIRLYAGGLGLTFPLVLDPEGKINALYGVVGVPTTFLVGRDWRAVAFAVGPRAWASPAARALIQALLAEPAPADAR